MPKLQPKTLARTLAYVGQHSPAEFGLFWDPDGTMPWKEFYWALQEDPELRFVRESNLRELALLGIEIPFVLEGNLLRLREEAPVYPVSDNIPDRLYFSIKPKNMVTVQKTGIHSTGRAFVPLCSNAEMAFRIAKRRESEPIGLEIQAIRAWESGVVFRSAGAELFLVEAIPADCLVIPKIRHDLSDKLVERKEKTAPKAVVPPTPGSFFVQPQHILENGVEPGSRKGGRKDKRDWKRDSRKERNKRSV